MGRLAFEAFPRALDDNGDPVSGAKLRVFEANTSTSVTTYSDEALTTAQADPVVADSEGYFDQIYLPDGLYKVRIFDADDNLLDEADWVNQGGGFRLEVDDVAALSADTTFAYSAPGRIVAAGDIITSRSEGFAYEVAASGASDQHVTTAGGVKLYVLPSGSTWYFDAFAPNKDGATDDRALMQTAVDHINSEGGGTLVVSYAASGYFMGASALELKSKVKMVTDMTNAQRGGSGGAFRAVRLIPGHSGSIVQIGAVGTQCNIAEFSGFSIYAESGDTFYQNFTGIEIIDARYCIMKDLFVGGAVDGYLWTAQNGAVQYLYSERLAADDCSGNGHEFEVPTPAGDTSPFLQANIFGMGSVTNCGLGIYIGGGQMVNNDLVFEGGQCGGHTSYGLHMDGDETDNGATRCVWTLKGTPWFENSNSSGAEVQVDGGTLNILCDMNTGRVASSGKGRVVSWIGHAQHDFMIPVTGFPVSGLQRCWSFRDIGADTFYCPISGVAAQKTGSGTKSTDVAETKFRSGIKGDGSGGGWTVDDVTFDWTADWTVAFLAYNTANSAHLAFTIEDSGTTSSLDLSPRPAYLRLRTEDSGGGTVSQDLGGMNTSYLDAPQWFVLSYDASATLFTFYGPNGQVLYEHTQAVPSALSASGYTDWLLNGGQNSTVILDETAVWDRILTGDEVLQVCNLNTDLHAAIGHEPRGGVSRSGTATDTTDGNGNISITHGLATSPNFASVQVQGDNAYQAKVQALSASAITVLVIDASGADVTSTSVTVGWRVEL